MLARPAKGKLVKLAKACFPPGREPNSRSGAVTTVTLAIQVADQIGGSVSVYPDHRESLTVMMSTGVARGQRGVGPVRAICWRCLPVAGQRGARQATISRLTRR